MRVIGLAAVLLTLVSGAAVAQAATGEWLVANGKARIRISPCGGALCGAISWLQTPTRDENNPDPAKRNRSLVGTQILRGMRPAGPNRWEGEIYNAENGQIYMGSISMMGADMLRVEGCVLGGLICGGENWTRVK